MSYRYLETLARKRLPIFVARPSKVRALRQLAATGHVEVSFYPPEPCAGQFGEVRSLTPAGWSAIRGGDSPTPQGQP
ncbi:MULTISPECIES: hypothetical protein [Variovorax]|uniref:hypothetical protein n=1 Tax=Variovorax TaxID=34072 RepID=UPI00285D8CDB|nr:hypothetical protein [Variovorax sp. 3319]MDR6888058.1 hypothetical protein [Variovorax sp. 3319]